MDETQKIMIRWFSIVAIFLIFGIVAIVVNLHPYEINVNANGELKDISKNMMMLAYAPKVCENQTTIIMDDMNTCINACKWSFGQVHPSAKGINGFMKERDCSEYCYQTIDRMVDKEE